MFMNCREFEEGATLLVYDELSAEARVAAQAHAASCEACRTRLEELRGLQGVLNQRSRLEPSLPELAEARRVLDEALDREQLGWRGLYHGWLNALRLRPAPALAVGLTLILFGFGLGWTLRPRASALMPGPQDLTSNAMSTGLENMRISGISRVAPDPKTGGVRITMDAERRVTLEGSLDDPRIQQVLVYAIKSYDNPGIRRDTLDALRTHMGDPKVRQALVFAMRNDANVGMRLEALDVLRGLKWDANLRQAFLETLERDKNPGVRVAAVDVLAQHADEQVLPRLEKIAATDSNCYVRLKCANAVMKLGK
jgi:hypothetical protein